MAGDETLTSMFPTARQVGYEIDRQRELGMRRALRNAGRKASHDDVEVRRPHTFLPTAVDVAAWAEAADAIQEILPYHELLLLGRIPDLFQALERTMKTKRRLIQIIGAAGVGKSTFATILGNRLTADYGLSTLDFNLEDYDSSRELDEYVSAGADPFHPFVLVDNIDSANRDRVESLVRALLENDPLRKVIITIRKQLRRASEVIELDNLPLGVAEELLDHRLGRAPLLQDRLRDRTARRRLVELTAGNPGLLHSAIAALAVGEASLGDVESWFDRYAVVPLRNPAGVTLTSQDREFTVVRARIEVVNARLLASLRETPSLVHRLSSREFEELVAELFMRQGFDVQLTPPSRDGGVDIYVAQETSLGSFLYVVDCKKFAPNNPVGVELVRRLVGTVEAARVTAGLLVTTSYFTRGAREAQRQLRYRIALRDYVDLRRWLQEPSRWKLV